MSPRASQRLLDRREPLLFCEPTMKAAIEIIGDDNFLWDTDYPHPDGTFPWGIGAMLEQPIADASRRKIWWDNAARAFALG